MKTYIINFLIALILLGATFVYSGERRELIEKRTYNSKTFENIDGTFTTEVSLGYWHYRITDGRYKEIKPNFLETTGMLWNYQVTDGLYHTYMKDDISKPNSIIFETKDGYQIGTNLWGVAYLDIVTKQYHVLQSAQPAKAMVSGNVIVYPNVFNNVDVKYTYKDTRLKEDILLSQEARNMLPNPNKFGLDPENTYLVFITRLNVNTDRLKLYMNQNSEITDLDYEGEGRIDFHNMSGKLQYYFPEDIAYLQSNDEIIEYQTTVRKRIIKLSGNRFLFSGVPLSWIKSVPEGTIIIDPQIAIQPDGTSGKDASVRISYKPGEESWANNNYGDVSYLAAGAWTRSGKNFFRRGYFQFDLSAVPVGATLENATLNLFSAQWEHGSGNEYRSSISSSYLKRVTQNWDEHTITWNNQPATDTTNQLSIPAPATTQSDFDLNVTQLVNDMLANTNYGFNWVLQTEVKYRRVFTASSDYADPAQRPRLTLHYTLPQAKKYFYLKDHLGNIRVTIDDVGEVVSYNDYYPFGLQMPGRSLNNAQSEDIYKFSGKELDEENGLDWYYFGARYYDPAIGRFLSVDPLAHEYPSWSPYNYTFNNPLRFIDPTGMGPEDYEDDVDPTEMGGLGLFNSFLDGVSEMISNAVTEISASLGLSVVNFEAKVSIKAEVDDDGNIQNVETESNIGESIDSPVGTMTQDTEGQREFSALGAVKVTDDGKIKIGATIPLKVSTPGGLVEAGGEASVMKVFDIKDYKRGFTKSLEYKMKPSCIKGK